MATAVIGSDPENPRHFRTPGAFRRWLEANHARADELWVGFYKKASGKGGLTYQEALDEALCFGWIDGLKKRVDDERYTHRFSPRTERSSWSATNVRRYGELEAEGRIAPPGAAAFARFTASGHPPTAVSERATELPPEYRRAFEANAPAWRFFQGQAPSCRRQSIGWVMDAKRAETRERRLRELIEASARGGRPRVFGHG